MWMGENMKMNQNESIQTPIPLDKWFPAETNFEEDMKLYWGDFGVASEVDDLKAVLLRRPGKEIENFDSDVVRFRDKVDANSLEDSTMRWPRLTLTMV